jgi:hypothetical protein
MKFYDTCSLLNLNNEMLEKEIFIISSITLKELEEIKISNNKTEDIKYQARQLTNWLKNNKDKYKVIIFKNQMLEDITYLDLPINNDTKILSCAMFADKMYPDELLFVTNDLSLYNMANLYFGEDSIIQVEEPEDEYTGYTEV